jgi:hypothetical protein
MPLTDSCCCCYNALVVLTQLLGSKTATDVQETINFFVVANRFQIEAAADSVKKMLPLVWSKDTEIKNAVIGAYKILFLTPPGQLSDKATARFVATNLTKYVACLFACLLAWLLACLLGLIVCVLVQD